MPRCNLTLKQKIAIIELSNNLSTEQLSKKFKVHPTTITRTLQKKTKITQQASRVNNGFKTVQTNERGEEHDSMVLDFIRKKEELNELVTIQDICDKAVECAAILNRSNIKSKRGWWRRFKKRCNIIKSKFQASQQNIDKGSRKQAKNQPKKSCYTYKIREHHHHHQHGGQGGIVVLKSQQ